MSKTDDVLRGVVKEWLSELPQAERDALLAEVGGGTPSPPEQPPGPTTERGSLAAGAARYDRQHGRTIAVEGPEHVTEGRWS